MHEDIMSNQSDQQSTVITLRIVADDGGERAIEQVRKLLGNVLTTAQLRRFQKLSGPLHELLRKDPSLLERLSRDGFAALANAALAVDRDILQGKPSVTPG